ncbi:rho guanine nucleotide exchange factor 11 [Caerostris extrusa]|uniref:Rho guanine nucleotide exchange factor 11 n=1 Tax=Caerostris extrusa TaxID=172846 RepID=A0AAV4VR11_CAEEX|nr:rho guanine nucleotide exchange factor 11 [Caerostris extrusa]
MDKSSFEKIEHPVVQSFKNLDLTEHKLLYEGPLLWRHSKQKHIEMHVVLMEDILILFQKQDEKYILKFHNTILTSGREDTKIMHSPILRVQNIFSRENATDKRTFFIVSSSELHAIYEFVAATASEKKVWCNYIDKTAQEFKRKVAKSLEASHPVPEPPSPIEPAPENTEVETKTKNVEPTPDSTESSNKTQSTVSPENNLPPPEPEEPSPPPSEPPDDTPQRAKQVGHDEDASESGDRSKRLQHIQILEITEGPQLIEPSEVIVSSGAVCETAEPVLTPFEKLRRKDLEISKAIEEKEVITAEILQITLEDLKNPQDIQEDTKDMNALDLITVAVQQGNKLASCLNEGLSLEETPPIIDSESSENLPILEHTSSHENTSTFTSFCRLKGVPLQSLLPVSTALNQSLAQLVVMISNMEEERKQLRKELANCQEQIHQLHEAHRHCITQSQSPSMHSRPSSFVSVASTASDGMSEFFESQHLFSVLEKSEEGASVSPIPKEPAEISSLVNEDSLPTERRTLEEISELDDRTCDQTLDASYCDVQNSATNANESSPTEDDSVCRTVQDEHTVDPVYL